MLEKGEFNSGQCHIGSGPDSGQALVQVYSCLLSAVCSSNIHVYNDLMLCETV